MVQHRIRCWLVSLFIFKARRWASPVPIAVRRNSITSEAARYSVSQPFVPTYGVSPLPDVRYDQVVAARRNVEPILAPRPATPRRQRDDKRMRKCSQLDTQTSWHPHRQSEPLQYHIGEDSSPQFGSISGNIRLRPELKAESRRNDERSALPHPISMKAEFLQ